MFKLAPTSYFSTKKFGTSHFFIHISTPSHCYNDFPVDLKNTMVNEVHVNSGSSKNEDMYNYVAC